MFLSLAALLFSTGLTASEIGANTPLRIRKGFQPPSSPPPSPAFGLVPNPRTLRPIPEKPAGSVLGEELMPSGLRVAITALHAQNVRVISTPSPEPAPLEMTPDEFEAKSKRRDPLVVDMLLSEGIWVIKKKKHSK